MIKSIFENPVSQSIGEITDMKTHRNGATKYAICYKDNGGHQHTRWSNWMRFDGYQIGDSIPVKVLTLPASFGIVSDLLAVNGQPQRHVEPYVLAMVAAGVGALIAGYNIGKNKK